ncbi:MAG: hypothetical protein K5945_01550, partial [Bacteroidaceae bacterium]|nr:hypothetical protein [Bacteroidaceae bacterium]
QSGFPRATNHFPTHGKTLSHVWENVSLRAVGIVIPGRSVVGRLLCDALLVEERSDTRLLLWRDGRQKKRKNARKTYTFCLAYTKTYTYVNLCMNEDYHIGV